MKVTVALPCYNAEAHVGDALDSLLGQTFRALEIVAIDDGSTDATGRILEAYARRDPRLRIVRHESNLGLIAALNRAVAEARGDYLARADADDVCDPTRIDRQVRFLSQHPEIGVLGGGIQLLDPVAGRFSRPRPVRCRTPDGARFMSILGTPVAHTTILARTAIMREYPYGAGPESLHTEDYELFSRMIRSGVLFANLPEPLVTVRLNPGGVSLTHEQLQVENFVRCARQHLASMVGWEAPQGAHRILVNRIPVDAGREELQDGLSLLDRLETRFRAESPGAAEEISQICDMQRVDILLQALLKGGSGLRRSAANQVVHSAGRLCTRTSRWYLASKLPRRRPLPIR